MDDTNAIGSSFSAPSFLNNVFTAAGDVGENRHKLLLVSIHTVLLESGFIGFDMDLQIEIKGFQFRNINSPKNILMLTLFYTLPGIIGQVIPKNGVVMLKFQSTGNIVNVYGSLYSASTRTYLLRLNADSLLPSLNAIAPWPNCRLGENKDGISFTSHGTGTATEEDVFDFWKKVKDELALPLLKELCHRAGLILPHPCFMMSLPTELKFKILGSLPGDDIAKVSCVCSELRYLASNDDLWKLKIVKEFDGGGTGTSDDQRGDWKRKFAMRWLRRRSMKEFDGAQRMPHGPHPRKRFRGLRVVGR